tara:strand:- start:24944 stop:26245 length:1302 start_codon:yes stop_codon:yes gene_type:complete
MGLLSQTQNQYYNSNNSGNYGDYQFTTLENIINAFMFIYVGEGKIISKINRTDVQFHAMRAVQELSYDVLKSFKSQELEVPNTLSMVLPQDYVNYVKLARVGSDGLEYPLYPARTTSDPFAITQNADGTYDFGQQKRVVTVTFSGVTGNFSTLSGEYLTLGYKTAQATQGFVSFRFHSSDYNTYDNPTGEGPVFGIDTENTDTETTAATKLMNAINDFGQHTVVQSGGVLTITYNEDMPNISSVNSTENTYQSNGVQSTSNFDLDLINAGTAAGDNIVEQVPSNTSENFEDQTPANYQMYDINYTTDVEISTQGRRYGLEPENAQINGSYFIDNLRGLIKFSSSLAGETVTLHYVSDGLGTDSEMVVHKFCEEACYKHIAYGVLSTRSNIPEYLVQRYKKERFAETRKAKIRLSNIKLEEFTQVLRGMSKQIK